MQILKSCENFNERCKNCDGVEQWREKNILYTRVACPSWDNQNIKTENLKEVKKMAKQSKSVRLTEKAIKFIENFPTSNRGEAEFTTALEDILRDYEILINISKSLLRDYFSLKEACYLVDITNSLYYIPQPNPRESLILSIKDSNMFENMGEKWEVDFYKLVNKIALLSDFDAHVVFLMCNEFWKIEDSVRNSKGFNRLVGHIFNCEENTDAE